VREVVELVCELGPGEVEPDYQGRGNPSGEIDRQYLDSTRIRRETGWAPGVELREGIRRTLDWYAANPEMRPTVAAS
jgi:nucleoside-diphosphate-sugar epimerase